MSSSPTEPGRLTYLGLFLTTLSLLQLELFLTRIFSVTMWYHFAFMAISLAMFGIAAGAVLVEIRLPANPHDLLAKASLLFSVSSFAGFALQLYIPVNPQAETALTAGAFIIISIPFVFAGVVICTALSRFPGYTGSLYTADLAGSAAGCILAIPILNHISAPTAVILNCAIAALAAAIFGLSSSPQSSGFRRMRWLATAACMVFLAAAAVNPSKRLVDLRWVKGNWYGDLGLYEKWNAFSRIWVGQVYREPFGWGLSPKYRAAGRLDQRWLNIDAGAATVITKFDGNFGSLDFLKYDVTSLAHYLRTDTSVLVVGVGGGRDILTALVFGQKRVTGVEINHDILELLTSRYADYSGNLHRRPGVTLIHDEARSYIARSTERFGIIQASLIDTWAATSAGAYALAENGLYTKEAWMAFLNHLEPDGILTVSRWNTEMPRLTSLATASLMGVGVKNPRNHMMIFSQQGPTTVQANVATILVSRRPFSDDENARIIGVSNDLGFVAVLTPEYAQTDEFAAIADPMRYAKAVQDHPLDISAPTDDKPFFFHMLRARDLLKLETYQGTNDMNLDAVIVLGALLGVLLLLTLASILLPLALRVEVRRNQSIPLVVYFASIGLAFMLVEIGQLQRLIVFLGHPIYGLSVVLFVLLLASSMGSSLAAPLGRWIWMLPVMLFAFIVLSPAVMRDFSATSTPGRIAVSAAMIFPTGFFMGMAFPMGMQAARRRDGSPAAWYWAINGAFSVISSVLAVAVAIFWGVTATLVAGLSAYVLALIALRHAREA